MDLPEIGVGNVLHLPVYVDGALLHLGDVHAAQGDAEFAGAAVEMPAAVSLTVNIMKNRKIERPRIDSGDRIFAVASTFVGRPLEDTIRLAFLDLIDWLESDYGFERWEAFQICGMVASLRIGNIWTVAAGFPRKYLKP